jgi:predicted integral membrane protein DUF2269
MTLYALILFSHIAGAFFLFAGLALEWAAVSYLRRNPARVQADSSLHLAGLAPRLYGPALGVILLSGGYLGSKIEGFKQGWVLVSLVSLFLIGIVGAAFTAPRLRALLKAFEEKSEGISASFQNRLHDPILLASVRFRVALVFGVVLLMVSKLNLRLSLVTIACAAALGILVALPAWRRSSIARVQVTN